MDEMTYFDYAALVFAAVTTLGLSGYCFLKTFLNTRDARPGAIRP